VNRFGDYFCVGDRGWVQRRASPGYVERHPRKIDNASVPAVTAQVVRRAHENAIDRARLDAQRTKHALRVINGVTSDLKTLASFNAFLANVNAVDRTCLSALIARDARCEIEAMKPAIASGHWDRQLGIFKVLCKRPAFGSVRFDPRPKSYPHAMRNGVNRLDDVAHPGPNSLHFVDHWAERSPFVETALSSAARVPNGNPANRRGDTSDAAYRR
jgi:hypothetical protein